MVNDSRTERYRRLTERLGSETGRRVIDELQVLALTQPDALREIEEFLDRGGLPREVRASATPTESTARR